MDCSRMKTFGEHEKLFADCQRRVMHIVGKCLDNIDEAANSIQPEAVSDNMHRRGRGREGGGRGGSAGDV